ncbi:hypothetical protein [Propylenella binzhouense]|uniref:Uncharacterized protein n=1 Tax=Propylenella binzhouense TaxID=2555902 RepID=A0A964T7K7_9HYPH|nr:hypothetical protein [Propylenella binzhouense]MYZ50003.1 hypothetical protein [Propylenella binzhouense]
MPAGPLPEAAAERNATPPALAPAPEAPSGAQPTTLGDLAQRLEAALAREARTQPDSRTAAAPRPESDMAAEQAAPNVAPALAQQAQSRPPRPASPAPAREAAAVIDKEGAVIDFGTRRREGADALEEEMARLLGELGGETGRR